MICLPIPMQAFARRDGIVRALRGLVAAGNVIEETCGSRRTRRMR